MPQSDYYFNKKYQTVTVPVDRVQQFVQSLQQNQIQHLKVQTVENFSAIIKNYYGVYDPEYLYEIFGRFGDLGQISLDQKKILRISYKTQDSLDNLQKTELIKVLSESEVGQFQLKIDGRVQYQLQKYFDIAGLSKEDMKEYQVQMDGSVVMEFQERAQVKKVKDALMQVDWAKQKLGKINVTFDKI